MAWLQPLLRVKLSSRPSRMHGICSVPGRVTRFSRECFTFPAVRVWQAGKESGRQGVQDDIGGTGSCYFEVLRARVSLPLRNARTGNAPNHVSQQPAHQKVVPSRNLFSIID
jgi:hypothetical protein